MLSFDKTNPKPIEVDVNDCVGILEKTSLEDKDEDQGKEQD